MLANASGVRRCSHHFPLGVAVEGMGCKVVCPANALHHVWETRLGAHLKKCPDARARAADPGGAAAAKRARRDCGGDSAASEDEENEEDEDEEEKEKPHTAERVRSGGGDAPLPAGAELVALAKRVWSAVCAAASEAGTSEAALFALRESRHPAHDRLFGADRRPKHLLQESGILAHMARCGQLDPRLVYLELGAGTGKLSSHLHAVLGGGATHHVLVDRMRFRSTRKAERTLRRPGGTVRRLLADLAQVQLDRDVPELQQRPGAVLAKHLCGAATDLALQAATRCGAVRHVALATCCHALCEWETFCNPPFFERRGFSRADFAAIARLSAWATLALDGVAAADVLAVAAAAPLEGCAERREARVRLGVLCKRLLDLARLDFARRGGFAAGELVPFTSQSREDALLLASRPPP